MSVSPTKPLSYTTAKFAFEFNEIFSVLWTILNRNVTAIGTDEFFRLERASSGIGFIHCCHTVFSSSEVGLFTLETEKVCIDNHRIFLRLTKIWRIFVFELRIALLKFLELQSFLRHFLNLLVKGLVFNRIFEKFAFFRNFDPFFTERAKAKVEEDSRSQPSDLKTLFQTLYMKDMAT